MDPCINPNGRDHYIHQYSSSFNSQQDAKTHDETWRVGRANHYLFDLNRDKAWATQIESKQKIKKYNKKSHCKLQ